MSELDDRLDIVELCARYNEIIDGGHGDRIGEIYTADARFAAPSLGMQRQGTDELAAMANGARGRSVHVSVDHIVDFGRDGTTARHTCTLLLFARGEQVKLANVGSYADELVRTADGWRFSSRQVTFAPSPQPSA